MINDKTREAYPQVTDFQRALQYHIKYSLGKIFNNAAKKDVFTGIALALREQIIDKMFETQKLYDRYDAKRLYYLSMEFLMGRSMSNNLHNLGVYDLYRDAVVQMGFDFEEILECENDAALGNGGLGRLAACFLESMASLNIPGYGYGINYEYGLFKQEIDNGYQKEKPDNWLINPSPWQIEHQEYACIVPVYGRLIHAKDRNGNYNPMWMEWKIIIGVPYDMPIVGYGGKTVNFLRLYSAKSSDEFNVTIFNNGDYIKAVEEKISSETISKVLYPSDSIVAGKELRLVQEYFFVACALRDIIRRYLGNHKSFDKFTSKVAIQLNDTHPAIAVAELMRLLIDEHDLPWEKAWKITHEVFAYTNHTLLPEALEKWPVHLMEHVLPRHLQIIYEINRRFLEQLAAVWPNDHDRQRRLSIVEEADEKQVRMANLAVVGSHSVNGVAYLHTELLKNRVMPDFHELWPRKFKNVTNGITQRRWLLKANPLLAELISETIGPAWITDLEKLRDLEQYARNTKFQKEFLKIKKGNKENLAKVIYDTTRVLVNSDSLFDIHAKRIHEYKRQLLNALHIIHQYLRIVEDGYQPPVDRTYIFSGKAAPGYFAAKLIIKLINNIADVINNDSRTNDRINVVFIPNYRVSLAEKIFPAADLSEQISTAGKEASGTGNMKFALNGALTVGTLDGANVEIMEEVGEENIYIFGLRAEEVSRMKDNALYHPWDYYNQDMEIKRVLDALYSERFCPNEPGLFHSLHHSLLEGGDEYFHLADFRSYMNIQEKIGEEYTNSSQWARKAILNVARIGKFSSDRSIREYAEKIWNIKIK